MHELNFLNDLGIVMLAAAIAALVFHKLKQPVLLGYIVAGIVIGPHFPGISVDDPDTINNISNLGVVLLLFSLGLDFSVKKLRDLGAGVLVVTFAEVGLMLWAGYSLAQSFGWNYMDSMFLGAILSLSSTMVASRTLITGGNQHAPFARTVIGMLVGEDVMAVILMTVLTAIALGGNVEADVALVVLGHLSLFVVVGMILGLLVLPRLVDKVAAFGSNEILLITVLGICFGFSLLADQLGFSMALGAFLAGIMIAESHSSARVVHLVEPLRDMFAALFFVAIGLRIDPALLWQYALPAVTATLVVMVGKTVFVSIGLFLTGRPPRQSLRGGMSMAVIGEFSFVIATLGTSLAATSDFLYPIAASVAVLCMLSSAYLIKSCNLVAHTLYVIMPKPLKLLSLNYSGWLQSLKPVNDNAIIAAMLKRFIWHIAINIILVVALFVLGAYINAHNWNWFVHWGIYQQSRHTIIWALALFLSLPMLIAVYRKAEALGMLLAELGIHERFAGQYTHTMRLILAQLIPLITLAGLAVLVGALSSTILPSRRVWMLLVAVVIFLALVLWRGLVKVHARLQAALRDTVYGENQ